MTNTRCALPAWLRPTCRAIEWTPLTLLTAAILVTSIIFGWRTIEVPALIQHLAVAGLAAAAVLGLGDPARPLLQAVPTPPIARLTHRVTLLAGATTLAVAAVVASERVLAISPTAEPALAASLLALAAIGVAVHASVSPVSDHANEAAAAVVLCVAAAALPLAFIADPVRMAWLHNPWPVTAAGVAITVGATTRRSA